MKRSKNHEREHNLLPRLDNLLAGSGCPYPEANRILTDPIPMYPDYTDIMIPTNNAPLNFLLRNDADAMQVTLKGESKKRYVIIFFGKKAIFPF